MAPRLGKNTLWNAATCMTHQQIMRVLKVCEKVMRLLDEATDIIITQIFSMDKHDLCLGGILNFRPFSRQCSTLTSTSLLHNQKTTVDPNHKAHVSTKWKQKLCISLDAYTVF